MAAFIPACSEVEGAVFYHDDVRDANGILKEESRKTQRSEYALPAEILVTGIALGACEGSISGLMAGGQKQILLGAVLGASVSLLACLIAWGARTKYNSRPLGLICYISVEGLGSWLLVEGLIANGAEIGELLTSAALAGMISVALGSLILSAFREAFCHTVVCGLAGLSLGTVVAMALFPSFLASSGRPVLEACIMIPVLLLSCGATGLVTGLIFAGIVRVVVSLGTPRRQPSMSVLDQIWVEEKETTFVNGRIELVCQGSEWTPPWDRPWPVWVRRLPRVARVALWRYRVRIVLRRGRPQGKRTL